MGKQWIFGNFYGLYIDKNESVCYNENIVA